MTATAHSARRHRPARTGHVRVAAAAAVLLALVPVAACGRNAQTLRPYTPAEGVNFDVGDMAVPDSVIHVRNLLVISRSAGTGIVSATMVTSGGSLAAKVCQIYTAATGVGGGGPGSCGGTAPSVPAPCWRWSRSGRGTWRCSCCCGSCAR